MAKIMRFFNTSFTYHGVVPKHEFCKHRLLKQRLHNPPLCSSTYFTGLRDHYHSTQRPLASLLVSESHNWDLKSPIDPYLHRQS